MSAPNYNIIISLPETRDKNILFQQSRFGMSRKSLAVIVNTPFLLRHEYVNGRRMTDTTQCKKD